MISGKPCKGTELRKQGMYTAPNPYFIITPSASNCNVD
jgi:hypothetical protein